MYGPELARIHHERFGDLARAAAEELLRRLRDAGIWRGAVADLGCGSGILASALSQAGYAVHGVDRSPDMLAIARETAPRATFVEGSWVDADLPPGTVAVTCVGECVNYLDDQVAREGVVYLYKTREGQTRAIRFFDIPSVAEKLTVMGPGEAFADTDLTALRDEIEAVTEGR